MSITCKSLDHTYGYNTPFEYYALKNVNLKIEKGSFTAIIGQTGSGKSNTYPTYKCFIITNKWRNKNKMIILFHKIISLKI